MAKDLTQGSITKNLLSLSGPIISMNLLHSTYAYVDMACVGRLGKEAVAAIAISMTFSSLFGTITAAFNKSVVHFVSQSIGEKDYDTARLVFTRSLVISFIVGFLIALFYYLNVRTLISFISTEERILELGVQYFSITAFSPFFFFPNRTVYAAFRADGDTKTALKISIASNILNIFLDIVLIFGYLGFPRLGIRGAALATLISRIVAGTLFVALAVKGWGNIKVELGSFSRLFNSKEVKRFLTHFFPGFIEGILRGFNQFFILKIISPFGAAGLSAHLVCHRITHIFQIPCQALGISSASITGQNLGADVPDRAWQGYVTANKIYMVIAVLGFGTVFLFPAFFIRIFIQDPEVISVGTVFVRLLTISVFFYGAISISSYTLNAAGNSFLPMLTALTGNYFVQLPLAFMLSRYTALKLNGIWLADPATHVVQAVFFIVVFRSGLWLKNHYKRMGKKRDTQEDIQFRQELNET